MDVSHVKLASILFGIGIAVEEMDATVRRLLMFVFDDRFNLPGEGRVGAALPVVVTRFNQMPQVIDHAGRDERLAFVVKCDPPRVARSFAEDLEFPRSGMNPVHGTREWPAGMFFVVVRVRLRIFHVRMIEDAVQSIQPSIRSPSQAVG